MIFANNGGYYADGGNKGNASRNRFKEHGVSIHGPIQSIGPNDLPSIPNSWSVACILHLNFGANQNISGHVDEFESSMVSNFRKVRRMEVARAVFSTSFEEP